MYTRVAIILVPPCWPYACYVVHCLQKSHSEELEAEREKTKEAIAGALEEERRRSKVKLIHCNVESAIAVVCTHGFVVISNSFSPFSI